jgi:predicted CoA-binding protein
MKPVPETVATFLRGKRFAVAGVSRQGRQPSNAILTRLRQCGYEVFPVNPAAGTVGGETCYPDLRSVPGPLDGVLIATHPRAAADVVRQCAALGITRVWFHRSIGEGSVSPEALAACRAGQIDPIVGGCPMMYCGGVDIFHTCMRWWLRRSGKIPG